MISITNDNYYKMNNNSDVILSAYKLENSM